MSASRERVRACACTVAVVFTSQFAFADPPKIADPSGTKVTITSDHVQTEVFLAKGPVPSHPEEDPFERVGVAPLDINLAPGIYTIETSGVSQSASHETFTVDRWPVTVAVKTGDPSVKTIGGIVIATSVISILAGIVIAVSFGKGQNNEFDKWTLAIPLLAGGAAGTGIGIGMTYFGSTKVDVSMPPASAPPTPSGAQAVLSGRF